MDENTYYEDTVTQTLEAISSNLFTIQKILTRIADTLEYRNKIETNKE